jgi:hydroxylamine reductase (hybrid-cluster protein)
MNCTVPTLADTCAVHGCLLIPVSDLVGVPGAEPAMVFKPETAAELARQLIAKAIANYPQRAAKGKPEWLAVRAAIFAALDGHPDARTAVAGRLLELEPQS